ncbi:coiled-coil domain-containing protein 191 isoform X3 [Esox lucius]|uniref:coiled-coil domain-containing protein 191 isoform X3 n=1 Tax=Esox lucius TaxID=8010 RepID=UPI0014769F5A|nr:coiled-coil domain-containing protein 191 isoform X3 [Esox lucius]
MAYSHKPDMFCWKRFTKSKSHTANKVELSNGDIDQWMKRVEMASDFAVSKVFLPKKPHSGISSHILALQSTDQLQDHDEAYCEAQALLSDWMNSKLRLELEKEEDVIGSPEMNGPVAPLPVQPLSVDYSNFDDLYSHLAEEEEESSVVSNFLQDLMECEVLGSGIAEDLALDSEERDRRKRRNPSLTMEARHRQVRENRVRREAERVRLRRDEEARREAREEAQRREQETERQKKQEARRQEEVLQHEMVQLRREMEERRNLEQLARQREREKVGLLPNPSLSVAPKQQQSHIQRSHAMQQAEARAQMVNLQRLQRHFSGWYTVLLERRVRMGKAAALCDWKRGLRAWRAWRALVWAGREQREVERIEEELRTQNRLCQVALESDRRRVLRRCLSDWQLWCRAERERRELLAQQDATRRKMAALISAVTTRKLEAIEAPTPESALAPRKTDPSGTAEPKGQSGLGPVGPAPSPACQGGKNLCATPTLPWQVTRRHAALTAAAERFDSRAQQMVEAGERGGDGSVNPAPRGHGAEWRGGRFEHRHLSQQQTIAEQRRLLREQQEQIARLQEKQSMMGLKQESQMAQPNVPAGPWLTTTEPKQTRTGSAPERNDGRSSVTRKAAVVRPCPAVRAMEERARQRAERRMEVENLKIKKEEERLRCVVYMGVSGQWGVVRHAAFTSRITPLFSGPAEGSRGAQGEGGGRGETEGGGAEEGGEEKRARERRGHAEEAGARAASQDPGSAALSHNAVTTTRTGAMETPSRHEPKQQSAGWGSSQADCPETVHPVLAAGRGRVLGSEAGLRRPTAPTCPAGEVPGRLEAAEGPPCDSGGAGRAVLAHARSQAGSDRDVGPGDTREDGRVGPGASGSGAQ